MKKFITLVFTILFLYGCDDGDIIVNTFNFDEVNLEYCGGPGGYLFFKINDGETESISLLLGTNDQLFTTSNTRTFELNGTSNVINYRIFNDVVTSDYFCNEIPATAPEVAIEYLASSGLATMVTTSTFNDDDGLPFIDSSDPTQEGTGDYDNDGIPNFYDFDDDGDNIPTLEELDTLNADGDNNPLTNPLDTDGDKIPDYLDPDDDGDGVETRYEANGSLDPGNIDLDNSGVADYLESDVFNAVVIDEFTVHSYSFSSDISLLVEDVVLINGEETITRETLNLGIITTIATGTTVTTPNFPEN